MSIIAVYNALSGAISGGSIDLWSASAEPDLTDMRPVLEAFGLSDSYSLSAANVVQGLDRVTLTGHGVFGQPGDPAGMRFAVHATLVFVQSGTQTGIFDLRLDLDESDLDFSAFFNAAALPGSQATDGLTGTIRWTPSLFEGLALRTVSFQANSALEQPELHLLGLLPESPLFETFADFLGPWPLALSGVVTMPTTWTETPVVALSAYPANSATMVVSEESGLDEGPGGLTLRDIGLQLIIETGMDAELWGVSEFSVLNLIGTVTLGNSVTGLNASLSTQILTSGSQWHLTAIFDPKSASIVRGMQQLADIFGLPELPLPENFPLLESFKFHSVELYFSAPEADVLPKLSFLAVTIKSDAEFTPPVPFVTLHDLGTRWVWGWTNIDDAAAPGVGKTISTVSGSVFGSFRFGESDQGADLSIAQKAPEILSAARNDDEGYDPREAGKPVDIDVSIDLPDLLITGQMRQGDIIPVGEAFKYFFGAKGPAVTDQANVVALGFFADPLAQRYSANTEIVFMNGDQPDPDQGWEIDLIVTTIVLQDLKFWIEVQSGQVGGGINATFLFNPALDANDYQAPRLMVSAQYPIQDPATPKGWIFEGHLYPGTSIDLIALAKRFMGLPSGAGTPPPASLNGISVDRLDIRLSTGDGSYQIGGTISARWTPTIFDTELKISAAASVDIGRSSKLPGEAPASGRLSGMFSVNKIQIDAGMDIGVGEPTYLLKVQYDEIWLQATTSWRGKTNEDPEKSTRHQAISLQLGGKTLGEILEYLVNLAAPTIGFSLDPPWDILNRIELSRFVLTIDPTDNVVEFVYKADVNLGFGTLSSIGVRYTKGGTGKVDLILEGSFLGQEYKGEDALAWDVVNDPPPPVPGTGPSLVDLRYLGIGQRIQLQDPPPSVTGTLALMADAMEPVEDPNKLPGTSGPIAYSADSQWLIGLDVGLLGGALDLGIIFNDPIIYGLSIGLNGEKAGSLAGLRFEILYKKISDDVGMFRVELRLPDAFRTFTIGIASFTLGTIVIEIYTNGNFKVDFGFPYNQDFTRSFSAQAYVFIGRGGLYLGVLNGTTSSKVPKITNGTFSPVIELGIGLAVGVGREIRAGILAGGAYVELQVIFEGVLSWFNPSSNGAPSETYFSAHGIAALHGKVYGYVDFKIIKVSVTLEAYAQVSAIFESYQPTQLELKISVDAQAKVKILFVTLSFSFHVELKLDYTLGTAQQTPWILDADQGPPAARNVQMLFAPDRIGPSGLAPMVRTRRHVKRRNAHLHRHYLRRAPLLSAFFLGATQTVADTWGWDPAKKMFPDGDTKTAILHLLPTISLNEVPISWTGAAPVGPPPTYRATFVACANLGSDAQAITAKDTHKRSAAMHPHARDAQDTAMLTPDLWVQLFLYYTLYSIPNGPTNPDDPVTSAQLALLINALNDPTTADAGFSYMQLDALFDANLHLQMTNAPEGDAGQLGGMAIPLPPGISWSATPGGDVNFATYNEIGPLYEWGVSNFMSEYFPVGGAGKPRPSDDTPSEYESYPTFIFRDYCLMIAKAAVTEVQDLMENSSVNVAESPSHPGETQTLSELALTFPNASVDYDIRVGDTVDSVAFQLGATPAELNFLNPQLVATLTLSPVGSTIAVRLGVAPEVIALDNTEREFALNRIDLGDVLHQVAKGETLNGIAALFNVQEATSLFVENGVETGLATSIELLQAGATFGYPAQHWTTGPETVLRAAATAYSRYVLSDTFESVALQPSAWYAQAVFDLNRDAMSYLFADQIVPTSLELPPGETLSIPSGFNQLSPTAVYVTQVGDTLARIGLMLTLEQVYPNDPPADLPDWSAFLAGVTQTAPNTYDLPAFDTLAIVSGESAEELSRRLLINAIWTSQGDIPTDGDWSYDWDAILDWLGTADVLSPLAVVPVPRAVAESGDAGALSFQALLSVYGLPVADVAERLADLAGLYARDTKLLVTHLPVMSVSQIVAGILGNEEHVPSIVNQASRSLLAGLQLPDLLDQDGHTVADLNELSPLYSLTGQQIDVAVDDAPSKAGETALEVDVTSQTVWVTFSQVDVVQPDDTHETLAQRQLDYAARNPMLIQRALPEIGMVVLADETETLTFRYTNEEIIEMGPALTFSVPVNAPPTPLPTAGSSPRPYGLNHRIELQTQIALPIPNAGSPPLSAQPSIWPFGSDLLARAKENNGEDYEILATRREAAAGRSSAAITNATWACQIPLQVKQVDGSKTLFVLSLVNETARDDLIALRKWLASGNASGTRAYALVQPAPDAGNANGLTVIDCPEDDIFLIQSNLSSDTVPPTDLFNLIQMDLSEEGDEGATGPVHFASLDFLEEFTTLLWKGAVVGGAGYYVGVNAGLPANAFDGNGVATIELLIIAGTQQGDAPDGRALLPFNNCALIGPGIDASADTLYVENTGTEDIVYQALQPPGNYGFTLAIDAPPDGETAELLLRQLFSLLTYEMNTSQNATYVMTASGMPVMPKPHDGDTTERWQKERMVRKGLLKDDLARDVAHPIWSYDQVVPFYRFGPDSDLPDVAGLPAPGDDPYRGFGRASAIPESSVTFGFGDILGNRTAPGETNGSDLDVPVGYTDPLIGVSDWPAMVGGYYLEGSGATTELVVNLSPRSATVMPSPSQPGGIGIEVAAKQAEVFTKSYYQLGQRITARVETSLRLVQDAQMDVDVDNLWQFAAANYAFSSLAAQFLDAKPEQGSTLGDVFMTYNVRAAEVATANAHKPIIALVGADPVIVPAFDVYVETETATTIANAQRPDGWPAITSLELLSSTENGELPLRIGARLKLDPAQTISTADGMSTLDALAKSGGATGASLASENAALNILQPGFTFKMPVGSELNAMIEVTDDSDPFPIRSFNDVVSAYAEEGINVTAADLAELNGDRIGIFEPDEDLYNSVWFVSDHATLANNPTALTQAQLAAGNLQTPALFDAGALLHLGTFGDAGGIIPLADQTLKQFSDSYACPAEALLLANSDRSLPMDSGLVIPGLLALPHELDALRGPYTLQGTDTLDSLTLRFDWRGDDPATSLADANANMPKVIAGGQTLVVQVGTTAATITTPASGASFAQVLVLVQGVDPAARMSDVATSLKDQPIFRAAALILCPLARLRNDTRPLDITGLYNISAGAFALANVATPGLIKEGQTIFAPDTVTSVLTLPNDTFNTLIVRFAQLGIQVSADELATSQENQNTAIFSADAMALLAPKPFEQGVTIGGSGPYPGPVFPLWVAIDFERPSELINPTFEQFAPTGTVARVRGVLPAPLAAASQADTSLTLNAFVAGFSAALPDLALSTGHGSESEQDLWITDFGAAGISDLTIEGTVTVPGQSNPQPRYFAIEPLYVTLVSREGVPIQSLKTDGSLTQTATETDFQSVDAEPWAARFLSDLDQMLNASNATALYLDPDMRGDLERIIGAKRDLIPKIANGLASVLEVEDPSAVAGRDAAVETLRQQLGINLAQAYAISTVVQFDRSVTSPWGEAGSHLLPANLYGQIAPTQDNGVAPAWTATAGKCWLDDTSPFVTVMITTADAMTHRTLPVSLEFDISDMEHNIAAEGLPDGYVASNWVGFLPPLAKGTYPSAVQCEFGEVTIPIPLRTFPALPTVLGQDSTQTIAPEPMQMRALGQLLGRAQSTVDLGKMPLWDHSFSYSHEHAEQDDVTISLEYNLAPDEFIAFDEEDPNDVFTELAKYTAVADDLWALLDVLSDPKKSPTQVTKNAVSTFAELASNIALYWEHRIASMQTSAAELRGQYAFELGARVTDRTGSDELREIDFLTLTVKGMQPGPNGSWPDVFAKSMTGETVALVQGTPADGQCQYNVPTGMSVPAQWPKFTLIWRALNVENWQNATGSVAVERNQKLLGPSGPDTNANFVFQTETVFASSLVTPLNVWSERIALEVTPGPDYIKIALQGAFDTLFPAHEHITPPLLITVSVCYAYELIPDLEDPSRTLVSETPVYLYPNQELSSSTAGAIQAAIKAWQQKEKPVSDGGEWVFSITLNSTVSGDKRPLLIVERLFCALE
jgi:hypothetical protein